MTWFKNKVTGVHAHKTGMDLHDKRQDVISTFGNDDEMIVKRTTL